MPRARFAYQSSSRVVTWPCSGDVHAHPSEEQERVAVSLPVVGPLRLVGAIRHVLPGSVIGEPFERDRIVRAVPGVWDVGGAIVIRDSGGGVPVDAAVRACDLFGGLRRVEHHQGHTQPERDATERLRQPRRVVGGE